MRGWRDYQGQVGHGGRDEATAHHRSRCRVGWIGGAGDKGNSLVGALDDVRIYRTGVKAAELKARRQVIARVPAWPAKRMIRACW